MCNDETAVQTGSRRFGSDRRSWTTGLTRPDTCPPGSSWSRPYTESRGWTLPGWRTSRPPGTGRADNCWCRSCSGALPVGMWSTRGSRNRSRTSAAASIPAVPAVVVRGRSVSPTLRTLGTPVSRRRCLLCSHTAWRFRRAEKNRAQLDGYQSMWPEQRKSYCPLNTDSSIFVGLRSANNTNVVDKIRWKKIVFNQYQLKYVILKITIKNHSDNIRTNIIRIFLRILLENRS